MFKKPWLITYSGILVLISLITVIGLYMADSELRIQSVVVDGSDDVRGLEAYTGQNLLLVNPEDIKSAIELVNPYIASAQVYKDYPHTLRILVQKRTPLLNITLTDGEAIVSKDGVILKKATTHTDSNLPTLRYYQPLYYDQFSIGSHIDNADVLSAITAASYFNDLDLTITTIDIANENMIVLSTEDFDVFMSSEKDISQQFQEFSYTYKQLEREGHGFRSLDVRFDKPIIKAL